MNNDKFLADKHIMIHYLLCTQEVLTTTADIPSGLSRLEVRALWVPLEGLLYDANNKDFYSKTFQSMNVSTARPYVKKFSRTKDIRNIYYSIFQHYMGKYAINRKRDEAYLEMEAAKYRRELQRFTYETYVLIFENNIRILSRNNEEMRDTRSVQKFLLRNWCSWFAASRPYVTASDAHKNDFAKIMAYWPVLYNLEM